MEDNFNIELLGGVDEYGDTLLSRRKRDLSWEDVENFYADKNNFAMFLVLPIIVLVYGGCAVIYCIARCRRYVKRRKRKPKSKQGLLDEEPQETPSPQSGLTTITSPNGGITAREGASSTSEVLVSMEHDQGGDTPLPWQVPGEKQNGYPAKGAVAAAAVTSKRQPLPNNQYVNGGFDDDFNNTSHQTPGPPPYEESMNYNRPMSKPPPYDNNKKRRESVEEIITLDPMPVNNSINQRKRRRSDGRPSSRQNDDSTKIPPLAETVDEEREKARALVRGDKPRRDIPTKDRQSVRERTPDIISHARTRPLEPRYRPPQESSDPNAMAKQAAQLLRLDHIGKQNKKQKRLVFIAE